MNTTVETDMSQSVEATTGNTEKSVLPVISGPSPKTVPGFITGFVKNTLGNMNKQGNYSSRIENGVPTLVYTTYENHWDSKEQREVRVVAGEERLAVRLDNGITLSNANRLRFCGTHLVYGNGRSYNSGEVPAQTYMVQAGAVPIPFSVFHDANLEIARAKVIAKAPSENITVIVKEWKDGKDVEREESRHYVGACLIELEHNFFLFDIDREELKHKIFNPFVVKLSGSYKTIEEAYLSLKPSKVVMAELEGIPVERQGEWFFIKRHDELPDLPQPPKELDDLVKTPPDARKFGISVKDHYELGDYIYIRDSDSPNLVKYREARDKWIEALAKIREFKPNPGSLRQGNNRPNNVELFVRSNNSVLVSGTVSHAGREHRDVLLKGWWEPVPNTAVQSWQISGEID